MPSVPPYSSTTIARCWFSRRISLSAVSTPAVPGSRLTSRARSPTVAARPAGWLGRNRSRTCTKPTTSSSSRPTTGKRDQLESATCLAARLAVIDASRNATSVRGVMTSRTSRSPARKTSSMSRRSSLLSDSCAATRSRSSSWLIDSPLTFGSPPSSRTSTSVDFDSSQMIGRDSVAIAFSGAATISAKPSARCRARRLGVSSPTTSDR